MARAERFALEPAAAHQLELDQLAALDLRLEGFAVVAAVNLEDDGAAEVLGAPLRHKDFSALYEELNGGGGKCAWRLQRDTRESYRFGRRRLADVWRVRVGAQQLYLLRPTVVNTAETSFFRVS
eukprot:COSAG03_NODE_3057_length_2256_cov_41.733426_3_plen_124_part_00